MSEFPLTPGDVRQVALWTRQKDAALELIDQAEAWIAGVPVDNPFLGSCPVQLRIMRETVIHAFAEQVAHLIYTHYHCRVPLWELLAAHPRDCRAEDVLNLALQTLHGQSVAEHARDQIRQRLARPSTGDWRVQGPKVTIARLLTFTETADHRYLLNRFQLVYLIDALECWATGSLYAAWVIWDRILPTPPHDTADNWFTDHPTPLTAVQSLRYFKNGRVDITFATPEQAQAFVQQFGPIITKRD